ncbi:MAG: hypothetical protein MJY76_07875, partial [Bacteroidales bacterium]|nr:hypothetical protein [Bacteroidales bacterium]
TVGKLFESNLRYLMSLFIKLFFANLTKITHFRIFSRKAFFTECLYPLDLPGCAHVIKTMKRLTKSASSSKREM